MGAFLHAGVITPLKHFCDVRLGFVTLPRCSISHLPVWDGGVACKPRYSCGATSPIKRLITSKFKVVGFATDFALGRDDQTGNA